MFPVSLRTERPSRSLNTAAVIVFDEIDLSNGFCIAVPPRSVSAGRYLFRSRSFVRERRYKYDPR